MKRARTCMLILFLALLLWGCGSNAKPAMYIEPAQLTEEETDIVNQLGHLPAIPPGRDPLRGRDPPGHSGRHYQK